MDNTAKTYLGFSKDEEEGFGIREIKTGVCAFDSSLCKGCSKKEKLTHKLRLALAETVGQNDTLRARVCELEAWVNEVKTEELTRDNRIGEIRKAIWSNIH